MKKSTTNKAITVKELRAAIKDTEYDLDAKAKKA